MTYWVLENPVGPGEKIAGFLPYSEFHSSWISGAEFAEAPPNPIELTWDSEKEFEIRKVFYANHPVLMRLDLLAALYKAGVDNLVSYPVIIRSNTSDEICHDYAAVNIIGALAAANMDASEVIDEGDGMIDVIFGSLVIDEDKAHGSSLFRLAESVATVVIHDKVKECLDQEGGFGLTFTEPGKFCG